MKIDLNAGKYTYVFDNGKQYALRYGEHWRELTGDNLIYWMACKIEDLQNKVTDLEVENDDLQNDIYGLRYREFEGPK